MKYSKQEIENEIQKYTNKPLVYKEQGYPYDGLTDRQFETLLYFIFKKEIEAGVFSGQFDDVSLMTGVGEQGRDCCLYYCHKSVGIVQCKHSIYPTKRLDKSFVAQEIIKFILHYLRERSLIDDPSNFTYYIAVSADFSNQAIDLLCDFNRRIVNDKKFQEWVNQVIRKYQAFQGFTFDTIKDELYEVLHSITVKRINASDLNLKLTDYQNLIPYFFSVKTVISVEDFRKQTEFDKKKELILQMASTSSSIAAEAVRLLRARAWLQDGTLEEANLSEADLQDVDLSDANLRGVDLSSANLQNTNLTNVNLEGSNLRNTNLKGAIFHEANLKNVDFTGAILTDAQELSDEQLAKVRALVGATMVSGKRYNGRFNLEGDLSLWAPGMRISIAAFYGVSIKNYEWGQDWNRIVYQSSSIPMMYTPELEEWGRLRDNPEGIDDNNSDNFYLSPIWY